MEEERGEKEQAKKTPKEITRYDKNNVGLEAIILSIGRYLSSNNEDTFGYGTGPNRSREINGLVREAVLESGVEEYTTTNHQWISVRSLPEFWLADNSMMEIDRIGKK